MTKDENGKLGKRMAELQSQFKLLEDERKQLIEQRGGIDRRLSEIRATQISLDGRFDELKSLSGQEPEEPKEPKKTIPKKKDN